MVLINYNPQGLYNSQELCITFAIISLQYNNNCTLYNGSRSLARKQREYLGAEKEVLP